MPNLLRTFYQSMAFYVAQDLCLQKKFYGKWSSTAQGLKKDRGQKKNQTDVDDAGNSFIIYACFWY